MSTLSRRPLSHRIGHWLDDDTNRYAAITVSMLALVAMFSCISYMAGVRQAKADLAEHIADLSDRNYRMIQKIDCEVAEILDTIAPDPKRKKLERCKR